MKKVVALLLLLSLLFVFPGLAFAAEAPGLETQNVSYNAQATQSVLRFYVGSKTYYVNDQQRTLDVAPFIRESRTVSPLRFVVEALGGTITWNQLRQEVVVSFQGKIIKLWIGAATAQVDGVSRPIDSSNSRVVPILVSGRTFIPVRFVLETLDAEVIWDPTTKQITIRFPKPALIQFENVDYRIKYPENWEKLEGSINLFRSPEGPNLNVVIGELPYPTMTLDEFSDASLQGLESMYPDLNIIDAFETTLAGFHAHGIVATASLNGLALKMMQVWTIKDGRAFIITYGGPPALYGNYVSTADQMLASFEIK